MDLILKTLQNELKDKYLESVKEINSNTKRILFLTLIEILETRTKHEGKFTYEMAIKFKDVDITILCREKEKYCIILNSIYDIYFLNTNMFLDLNNFNSHFGELLQDFDSFKSIKYYSEFQIPEDILKAIQHLPGTEVLNQLFPELKINELLSSIHFNKIIKNMVGMGLFLSLYE